MAVCELKAGDLAAVRVLEFSGSTDSTPYAKMRDGCWIPVSLLLPLPSADPLVEAERAALDAWVTWREKNPFLPIGSYSAVLRDAILATDAVIEMRKPAAPPDPIAALIEQAVAAARQLQGRGCVTGASLLREAIGKALAR